VWRLFNYPRDRAVIVAFGLDVTPFRAMAANHQLLTADLAECLDHLMSLADQVNAKMPDFTWATPVNQFRENH
jgi:hypothetical protein